MQSTTPRLCLGRGLPVPLEATFDAGRLTSDGGLPWLAEADQALGLCAAVAERVPDWRRRAPPGGAAQSGQLGAAAGVPDRLRLCRPK